MKEIFNTKQRFSIRKFSFGVASVLVGLTWLAPTSTAQVEESTSTTQQTTTVLSTTQTQGAPETTEPATTVAPSVQEEETTAEETMVAPEASTTGKRRGKRDVSGATQQPTVEFLNENNQVVDPNAVFDGKTGLNMQIKVRVTFQENATEKKATIKLGNLLTLADTGANNDSLKPFLKGVSSLSKPITNLTTPDGQKYRNSTNESDAVLYMGDTVTYSFNDNVKSVVIPLTVNRHLITGLKGVSATGTINGSTEGIEKSTPITVEPSQKDTDGQVVTGSSVLNAIDFKDSGDINRTLNLWFNSVTSLPGFETANTNNGYTVVPGITINNTSQSTLAPMFVDSVTFDMVLPKGIRYEGMARYENNFEKISESTDASGVTTIKFKRNNPYYGTTFRFNPKLKVDTNIYTESTGKIHIKDYTVQLRNYPATKDFIESGYKDRIYSFPIIHLTEQDDINFFKGVVGVFDNTSDSVAVAPVNGKQYVALGRFPFDSVARTLDDVNSREKELFYEFPTNPHFEVKGIQLPGIDNNTTITKVKVASKKNPVLHEVTLATPYSTAGSNVTSPPRFIDVKDLGLDDDDVLTQLVVPIGIFEAGKSYTFGGINKAKESQVFGKFLTPTDNYEVSTNLTLRDKDFDENNPNHNWKTGTGVMKVRLSKTNGRNDLRIVTPGNKTINYAKSDKITYEIRSDRANYSHFQRVTDLVDKAHLVLPEDVDVKSIHLKDQDGNDFTNEVTITTKVENGKKIHTIDFSGVSDDKNILGWVGSAGKPFNEKFMKVEVDIENNVASNKTVNYDQTLFVTTPEANVRPMTGHESLRAADPYNLVTNKQTIFTNKPVSTFLTLPKADRLDLTTEAKLTTDSNYSSANDTFRIVDISQDLNLKTSITNKLASEVGEVDMYIPIPKKGQNWGTNIQNKAFEYGFNLKGVDVSENPDFVNQFDISYASVDPSKLNGSLKGINDLKGETFTASVTPSTNLVRIKSKTGKKIPASSKFPIALTLGLDNVTTAEDGKTVNWNAYYQADYASGTTADKGRNIEIAITLGKVGVTFFEDANSNGTKDGGEQTITDPATTPKIEVYNAQGNKENVDNNIEKTAIGYVVKGLVSDQNYTIKLISTDPNKRFTTGTGNENRSSTTEPIVPTLTSVADTALKPVGLTARITLVQPSLTPVDDTSAVNGQEKTEVETAVRTANPTLPAGTTVTVATNGDATVTFPDGYSQVLTNTVSQRPTSQIPTLNPVDTDDTKVTGTGVAGATIEVMLPDGSKKTTTVGANGKWEVALDAPLAKDAVVKATQKEVGKKTSDEVPTTVVPTTADTFTPNNPVKTVVDNTAQLTPAEKTAVETAVKTANPTFPTGTTVTVANNGDVTITYPDQSVDTIPGADTVEPRAKSANPTVNSVDTDDLKVSGTGIAGSTIEVTLPDGTKKTTTVGADGKWEIALDAPLAKDAVVKATQKEVGKKTSDEVPTTVVPTTADTFTPATPAKTVVDNPVQLTPAEKTAVETAVKTANPTFPAGTTVTVANNGDVTITYPDESVDTIPGSDTVVERATSATPTVNPVDTDDVKVSGTGVAGSTIEVTLPDGSKKTTTVGQDGKWEVALDAPLAKDAVVKATQTEVDKKPSGDVSTTVVPTTADTFTPATPVKTVVDNPAQLTPAEKTAVETAVKTANPTFPAGTTVSVADNGDVTITYPDQSVDTIPGADVIVERETSTAPTVDKVDTDDTKVTGTGVAGATIEVTLPDGSKKTTTVGQDGKWEVSLDAPLTKDDVVKATQTEVDKKPSGDVSTTVVPTTADTFTPATPVKTVVDNPAQLTPAEKTAVETAVKTANPTFPAGTTVTVANNGDVTITYPDESVDTIPGSDTVVERATSATPTVNPVDTDDVKVSGTGVAGSTIEVTLPDGSKKTTTVGQDGKWEVALDAPLAKDAVVKATQTEVDKKPSGEATTTVVFTFAEKLTPNHPEKTAVENPAQLTQDEKDKVIEEVKKANPVFPAGTTVSVADNGDVTITYPDESMDTIPGQDTVALKPIQKVEEKAESLPNTGTKSEYLIFGAAATSILLGLGLVKRNEDEEATN